MEMLFEQSYLGLTTYIYNNAIINIELWSESDSLAASIAANLYFKSFLYHKHTCTKYSTGALALF